MCVCYVCVCVCVCVGVWVCVTVRVPVAFRNKGERVTGPQPERVRSIFAGVNATRTSGTRPEREPEQVCTRPYIIIRCLLLLINPCWHGPPLVLIKSDNKMHTSLSLFLEGLLAFNDRLNVRVTPHCIDRCHRLGRQQSSTGKPRPVIVKFVSYETRRQVFSAKRRLK